MQVIKLTRTYRNINRYRHILMVLLRYGFDDIIERIKIGYRLKIRKRLLPQRKSKVIGKSSTVERLRLALEELGPTFVKFGQMLSVRPDLLPEDVIQEFQKFQNEVTPFPGHEAQQVLQAEFGQPVEQLFSSFEATPFAAASIAQVHRAVIRNRGASVVVKIQRPQIQKIIQTDLNILFDLANLIERNIPEMELYNPVGIVREFAKSIRRELDFMREGRNIDRFRRNFKHDDTVHIPQVYWDLTSEKVLTMEFIDGLKISENEKLIQVGLDPKVIALHAAQATLKQIFEHGFFHADPHPGNILILPNNVIAPLDFGMMGSLDDESKAAAAEILAAVVDKNIDKMVRVFAEMGVTDEAAVDVRGLKQDLTDFIERYYQIPLYQLDVARIITEIIDIIRRHRIKLPTDLVLMGRALMIEEGIGRKLDPQFDLITLAKPYVQKLMLQRLNPRRYWREWSLTLDDFTRLIKLLPADLRIILSKIKRGDLNIKFEHRGLDFLVAELDKASNRLAFSLIMAALIIGSSLMVQSDKGPLFLGLSVIGIIGYFIAAMLGLWLVIAILRSGKL